ncbi:MAG: ATP-binding protein [Longimicrobiales bacterium]
MTAPNVDPRSMEVEGLALDPGEQRAVRARQLRTLNTRTVPLLRLLGANFLVFGAVVHNSLILGRIDWTAILVYTAFVELYCLASWWALDRWYDPDASPDLALLFLVADLVPMAMAVYLTGADASWIFWVFLVRVVDQTHTYFMRAFMFTWLATLAYASVIGWAVVVDGATVNLPGEIAKLMFLVLAGSYISFTARTSERVRSRLADAIRTARQSVTELRVKSRQLEQAREAAEAGSQAKSQFLSRVSHELRTPMNAILGFAQLLQLDEMTEEQQAHVDEILTGGRHLLDIINEVMDIARVETGSLAKEVEPIRLGPVLREGLERAQPTAERRNVTLPERPPPGSDAWVMGSRRKVRQVFANLLDNAIKYNSSPGTVSLACGHRDGTLRVSVTDTGPGLPAGRIEAAFTPFERLGAEKTDPDGTGLGLPVARSLVEAMNGRIGVDSEPGSGSTFWFELLEAEPPLQEEARVVDAETTGPLVLYVDDKPENVVLVRRILARRPTVRLISSPLGLKGLETARQRRPDLILLDLELPDIAGREVLTRLQDDVATREIPVVVVSAEAEPSKVERLLAEGARAYFVMPYDVAKFLDVVDDLLDLR